MAWLDSPLNHAAPGAAPPRIGPAAPAGESPLEPAAPLGWEEIYHRLQRDPNDAPAFAALERRVARWAGQQLSGRVRLSVDRADVVADTCSAVVLGLARAYGPETFAGFVYGHYLNVRRRALLALREPVCPLGDLEPAMPVEYGPLVDELGMIARCLAELPTRERVAVEMRYFSNASARQIAEKLGVTEGNARRIVHNGLTRMRQTVQRRSPAAPRALGGPPPLAVGAG
jgi:DNA-directed RNA polymerase specialized sigma24 family protein